MVTFALACVFRTDDKLHLTAALDALGGLQHEVKRDITFESCHHKHPQDTFDGAS